MTSSSLTKIGRAILTAFALGMIAGCIADTAEDSDLPWASSRSWEGLAPLAPSMMDRYE